MERMVVLVTPQQKRAIVSRAKARRLSMGEMVRRSVEAYDSDEDKLLLDKLIEHVRKSTVAARQALAEAEAEVRKTLAYFAARRSRKAA